MRRLPHGETLVSDPPALTMARVTFSTAAWSLSSSRSGRNRSINSYRRIGRSPPLSGLAALVACASGVRQKGAHLAERPPSLEANGSIRSQPPDRNARGGHPILGDRLAPPSRNSVPANPLLICAPSPQLRARLEELREAGYVTTSVETAA